MYLAEGIRLVERALRAEATIRHLVTPTGTTTAASERERAVLSAAEDMGLAFHEIPEADWMDVTKGRELGRFLALLELPDPHPAPEARPGEVLVIGVDILDPGNTGAMIRSCLAAGACGFIGLGVTDAFHPRAVRTSMGSLFKLPIFQAELNDLKQFGWKLVTTSCEEKAVPLPQLSARKDGLAVLFGSEAFGLPSNLLEAADTCTRIPMQEGVDSYSVNAACAVVLYQLLGLS